MDDFILPYFVTDKIGKEEIESMPGIYRFSIDELVKDLSELKSIKKILLFGITEEKTETGENAYCNDGIVQRAIRMIKKKFKNIEVIADVCLCGYTYSGHCGMIKKVEDNSRVIIDNQKTIAQLARIALSYAEAGADFVAPSAMARGQVSAIRKKLNKEGYGKTKILAYSAKYHSSFYGPFRDALSSAPQFGDRSSYQLDYRNSDQALAEVEADVQEGADMIMVKPALAYLDIIYKVKEKYSIPLAAYNVSGEYSLIKNLSNEKEQKKLVLEMLTAIKRAGADLIISYWTKNLINWLK
ncbi:MAG: porphobilinogen synthase [Candidatus Omnitrophica bacterium]|nr:porphobilinogen synthase [Candidatus Omnitrophota bacterium]